MKRGAILLVVLLSSYFITLSSATPSCGDGFCDLFSAENDTGCAKDCIKQYDFCTNNATFSDVLTKGQEEAFLSKNSIQNKVKLVSIDSIDTINLNLNKQPVFLRKNQSVNSDYGEVVWLIDLNSTDAALCIQGAKVNPLKSCNNNGICEPPKGEYDFNCASDCAPSVYSRALCNRAMKQTIMKPGDRVELNVSNQTVNVTLTDIDLLNKKVSLVIGPEVVHVSKGDRYNFTRKSPFMGSEVIVPVIFDQSNYKEANVCLNLFTNKNISYQTIITQTYHILIRALNEQNQPIIGTSVKVDNEAKTVDSNGFTEWDLDKGSYAYELSRDGYDSINANVFIEKDTQLVVKLKQKIPKQPFLVVAGEYASPSDLFVANSLTKKGSDAETNLALDTSSIASLNKNTVIVGGPCSNRYAAQFLGVTNVYPDCAFGFESGQARIERKVFYNKNFILVAGLTAVDTQMGINALLSDSKFSDLNELSQDKLIVKGNPDSYVVSLV